MGWESKEVQNCSWPQTMKGVWHDCGYFRKRFAKKFDYFGPFQQSGSRWQLVSWKKSKGSEAAQRVCVWECSTVSTVSHEGGLSQRMRCSVWCFGPADPSDLCLSLIRPRPFGLFSWCRGGFHHVTEGDRFSSHQTTRASSSVSCPYLNPQPAFLFCAEVQSQFTQLSALSDCSKAAWK